ncbi:unnamed protein product [Brassicogethes aeneus]|uniref:Sperm-associated antigen 1 n=1 Tax=Brassicogethes aeneus TaxID=1431903 RepID=A0A9P0FJ41_BRAAE|nr:unnamed protein product [Brassicogethes aeneus]
MTQFAGDLEKLTKELEPLKSYDTLLSKYDIPLNHLDFDYIKKCTDGKELEKIYKILKSGEEGYYPDLTNTAEDRLAEVYPKSKLLRKKVQVQNQVDLDDNEKLSITTDLTVWLDSITKNNKELENRKSSRIEATTEIRKTKDAEPQDNKQENPKRISSTDYQTWDKFDPDTEILKIDLEEEKLKKEAQEREKKEKEKVKKKKTVKFNEYTTEAEAQFISEREKEKGNEFFKAKDYEEALMCYNNSIQCRKTAINLNNRAITHIKLEKFEKAVDDCDEVLILDPKNEKALLRKTEALRALKKYEEAYESVNNCIEINPNNQDAQDMANKLRGLCVVPTSKPTRMNITEISDDEFEALKAKNCKVVVSDKYSRKCSKKPTRMIVHDAVDDEDDD